MDMSQIPHTIDYQINKLKDKLQIVDQALVEHQSDQDNILNFEWVRHKKEKYLIEEDIRSLASLFQISIHPDPNTFA